MILYIVYIYIVVIYVGMWAEMGEILPFIGDSHSLKLAGKHLGSRSSKPLRGESHGENWSDLTSGGLWHHGKKIGGLQTNLAPTNWTKIGWSIGGTNLAPTIFLAPTKWLWQCFFLLRDCWDPLFCLSILLLIWSDLASRLQFVEVWDMGTKDFRNISNIIQFYLIIEYRWFRKIFLLKTQGKWFPLCASRISK